MATKPTVETMLDRVIRWVAETYGETAALEIGVWDASLPNFYALIKSLDDESVILGESACGSSDLTTALQRLLAEIARAEAGPPAG